MKADADFVKGHYSISQPWEIGIVSPEFRSPAPSTSN
jgi:hypothetical protein